ncbi:F-box/kelch-repeat protein At1g16250 isoform X2 [Amborella trichopoda]|uniref:Uncharacterized protein n=2 Tax=Amborella trichopoda TaxID=13333 RepID=W1P3D3_AMBTC|nr:F-box/kelch-repeat protein At1g16250 isoform X2 [Amborella trichopoda]ERN02091.1 hypothetical protein AMTR_s00045p00155990 [Amborella trichopoda]|eukprot:XP_020520417.1 F-box/kelch-repeat protein At1g16250 isoform X2 [Amborella trichopoda]
MPELPGEVFGAIRHGFSCVSISKRFLVIGGYFQSLLSIASKFSAMNDVIKFDPFKKQWSRAASMRTARSNFACAVIGGNVYVVGGCSSSETGCLALAEVYDPLEDRWEDIPPMPTPRWKCIGLSLKGLLYVIDGEDENHLPQCEVEIYDPVKKTWHHGHDSWLHSRPMIPPLFVLGDCILNLNDRHLNYIMIREAEVSKDATNGSWRVVGCVPKVLVHGHDRELVPFKFRVAKLGQEMYVVGGHALKYLQLMRFQIVKLNTVRAFTIGVDKRVEWKEVAPMCLSQVSVINCGALEE